MTLFEGLRSHEGCITPIRDISKVSHQHARARQEVFVFILHLFTGMPQMLVAQHVRGEGFLFLGSQ